MLDYARRYGGTCYHASCTCMMGQHPLAAVRRIAEACRAHGKLAGGAAETEAQVEEYRRLGYFHSA
ncbi:hypothetical protein CCS01_18975 [Rhodopila globiformis]|uniref:Uncharacterized protein n=1 Tax=Rhodopila globiformis TaxID=1071 RepID=A0A2S6N7L6_RHOGL|nr:hypothetical protein CCS01_18975 [Rhodopila globiformis]